MENQESVLKREFKQSDVQRVRNLINKKFSDKTTTSVGFSKKEEQHVEGDKWLEGDREWTIQDGILQNITKLDRVKQINQLPLFCPKCGKIMKHRNDKEIFPIHNMCFNCLIEFETELKRTGQWEQYETQIHNDEIEHKIEDFKQWITEHMNESSEQHFTEIGKLEKWEGKLNKQEVDKYTESVIEYLESLKRK